MKISSVILAFLAGSSLLAGSSALAPAQSGVPSARDVVAPSAFVSLEPVPRGSSFQIAVVMKIRPGFHVNAREVSEDYLIPTDLQLELPSGLRASAPLYPKGTLKKFLFSPEKPLNVYAGSAVIRVLLSVLPAAALGGAHIPLKLRYQACSDDVCLPPVTVKLQADFSIAAAGASARRPHPELFRGK